MSVRVCLVREGRMGICRWCVKEGKEWDSLGGFYRARPGEIIVFVLAPARIARGNREALISYHIKKNYLHFSSRNNNTGLPPT